MPAAEVPTSRSGAAVRRRALLGAAGAAALAAVAVAVASYCLNGYRGLSSGSYGTFILVPAAGREHDRAADRSPSGLSVVPCRRGTRLVIATSLRNAAKARTIHVERVLGLVGAERLDVEPTRLGGPREQDFTSGKPFRPFALARASNESSASPREYAAVPGIHRPLARRDRRAQLNAGQGADDL